MRIAPVAIVIVLAVACGGTTPTQPTGQSQSASSTQAVPAVTFPPLVGPSRTFAFDRQLSHAVSDSTRQSRFHLYDNGAFELRYPGGSYRGGYAEVDGVVSFSWEGWSAAGAWEAEGTVRGEFLEVRYNVIMRLTDFEDAVYRLQPPQP
jgi:hypothetical protein